VVTAAHSSRPPRPAKGHAVSIKSLRPEDAFLLSRIDGDRSEAELAALTGQGLTAVKEGIARLAALGAVLVDAVDQSPPKRSGPPTATRSDKPGPSNPVRAEQPVDLELDQQRKVVELFGKLETIDFYTLLDIRPDAEAKAIKKAYYASAPGYHPDRYYGKNLGPFKQQMEAIFGRITVAYDTLKSKETRAEYDAYLATQHETQRIEELIGDQATEQVPSFPPEDRADDSPKPAGVASAPASPVVSSLASAASAPPMRATAPLADRMSSRPPRTAEQERARREAFAKKLARGRTSSPPQASPGSNPPGPSHGSGPPAARPVSALEDLKRRHAAAVTQSGGLHGKVRQYFEAAGQAAANNNPAAAANAYRLALDLDPENPVLISAYEAAAKIAATALAGGYLKQADYEARGNRWAEAARSYVHAAAGMPDDGDVAYKAASALLKASGDLHQAAKFASRAIALAPKKLEPRLLLVEIYLLANMPRRARSELEAAREIAPQDDKVKELAKRLK
jgi:curved DNA-binding protein CbpA